MLPAIRQPILIGQGRLDATIDSRVPNRICHNVSSKIKEVYWFEHSAHKVILDQELHSLVDKTVSFMEKTMQQA